MNNHIKEQQVELSHIIHRHCENDGVHFTGIPQLYFIRSSFKSTRIHTIHEPALCIVAQGEKIVVLAQDRYQYDASHYLVVSFDLPISGEIITATPESPYLCLRLDFEQKQIVDLMMNTDQALSKKSNSKPGLFVNQTKAEMFEAVLRLVRLLDTPKDIPVLAPLMIQEILYRLLEDDNSDSIKQIAIVGGHGQKIAQVINRIKQDFTKALSMEELALSINMSSSSLHDHFKRVTKLSPLQYQKQLRLQEARRLILSSETDAATAGFRVGYESPSQFSREYSRLFGQPPMKDLKRYLSAKK
ncbi:AraC family transcriptional regulator [Shouchella miscanthi]|uniref:AraC family transcriptional regulator n=1 Tax=Shouchella miscanthi TaxID=2598861 RepID=UPI0011A3B695|nr:AraC family transcriptional regulator [Shouchella miscanthi]